MRQTIPKWVIAAIAAGTLAGAGGLALWWLSDDDDPESLIKAALISAAAAAEARDLGGVIAILSEKFEGKIGSGATRMGYRETRRYIFARLQRGAWRRIILVDTVVDLLDGKRAKVTTGALMARGEDVNTLEDFARNLRAESYRFDLDFTLEDDGTWRIIHASYQRTTAQDLLDNALGAP